MTITVASVSRFFRQTNNVTGGMINNIHQSQGGGGQLTDEHFHNCNCPSVDTHGTYILVYIDESTVYTYKNNCGDFHIIVMSFNFYMKVINGKP